MLPSYFTDIYVLFSFVAVPLFIAMALIMVFKRVSDDNNKRFTMSVLGLCVGLFICLSFCFYNFIVDDVFISLRYARNLADGYGLVFNTHGDSPLEGYTNFLWVFYEAILFLSNLSDDQILHVIRITGILFGAATLICTYQLMRLLEIDNRASLAAVLLFSAIPEFSFWAAGGLETGMYLFFMVSGLYRYLWEKKNAKLHILSMLLIALMALTRPEGLFFAIALIGWDLLETFRTQTTASIKRVSNYKRILSGIITFLIIWGAYYLWRYSYYGYAFPNTYYAKKLSSGGQLVHRVKQVSSFIVRMFPFFSVACLGFLFFNKKVDTEKRMLLFLMLVLIAFCFAARNEWMPGYRYELPFLPLLMVFLATGLQRIFFYREQEPQVHWPFRAAKFAALFFLAIFTVFHYNDLRKVGNDFTKQLYRGHVPLAKWLKEYAPENSSYASWDMGAVPFISEIPQVIDINSEGLLNAHTAHEGYDVDHLISLNPSFLVLPPNNSYVRPADILDFYKHDKLKRDYEYLFSFAFTEQYLLHVYKHRKVMLSEEAIRKGRDMAEESMKGVE